MQTLTGRCLCEAIAYEITGDLGTILNCHCSKCRRWHGAAFRTRCTIPAKNFKWLKGVENLAKYYSSKYVAKTFCKTCGSSLISLYDDKPDYVGVPIGALEQDPHNRPVAHIYATSKSPWFEITDDLPQFEARPPKEFDAVVNAQQIVP